MTIDQAKERGSFVDERIAYTLDNISGQMALIFQLETRGHDPGQARDRLASLQHELHEWLGMRQAVTRPDP